ncbi:MAG: diguanylate cyclase [Pseudonocardia sp.]|nr:diguanylate cyclase [Pseudonocardia sp.]
MSVRTPPFGTTIGFHASMVVEGHVVAADDLARAGRYEQAYAELREAIRLLRAERQPAELVTPANRELDRLRREHAEARELSRRDSLTDTYNRRYLDEQLASLRAKANGLHAGMAIALVDIDHFKQINDSYGHPFGDRVLQRVVAELDAVLSAGAFCARYGGEEFALVFPGCDLDDAITTCEQARQRVDDYDWSELDANLRVWVSIGVGHTPLCPPDVDQLIKAADVLLYAAKESGRNAVAFREPRTLRVQLAGPAGGRRAIPQPAAPAD